MFQQHVPLFTQQQNQTAVNVAMRNAAAQMQIDLANAGSGYYQGINIPAWPIGLTIVNPAERSGVLRRGHADLRGGML